METVILYSIKPIAETASLELLERQFKFLTCNKQREFYVLFDKSEKHIVSAYKKHKTLWFKPIFGNLNNPEDVVKRMIDKYQPSRFYITNGCSYYIKSILNHRKTKNTNVLRALIPAIVLEQGLEVVHVLCNQNETNYNIVNENLYFRYSGIIANSCKPSVYIDFGYYQKNVEVPEILKTDKLYYEKPNEQFERQYGILKKVLPDCTNNSDMAMFMYVFPEQYTELELFGKVLLALSKGTVPLLHPSINIERYFGRGFENRETFKPFMQNLKMYVAELIYMTNDEELCTKLYQKYMSDWHDCSYYQWLKDRV